MSAGPTALRLAFGLFLLASGLNHFAGPFWPEPEGTAAMAVRLLDAFRHSGLLDVAMAFELALGALILAGVFVPAALCVAMPIQVCAAYWALVLEGSPLWSGLALAALAANAALMLGHLGFYRGVLAPRASALGERAGTPRFDAVYMAPLDRLSPPAFAAGLAVLAAAVAFYWYFVPGRYGLFCLLTMVPPALFLLVSGARGLLARD